MARRRTNTNRKRHIPGITDGLNITPLLDIIFNLLFFFVMAATISTTNSYLNLTLPKSSSGKAQENEKEIPEISLNGDGVLTLDGNPLTVSELKIELSRRVKDEQLKTIRFAGDAQISYQQMIEIAEVCTAAGIRTFLPKMERRVNNP